MARKAPPEQRKYRYVHWLPERRKWIVKRRGFSSSQLRADTQEQAAKLAAKAFGCTVKSLLLSGGSLLLSPARHFRNVCWDRIRKRWRVRQVPRQPRFQSEEDAAHFAARLAKVPLAHIKLPCPKRTRRDTNADLRCRFKLLMRLYCTSDPKSPCIPGDLMDLISRPYPTRMAPGLLVPFILSKFAPHRDALTNASAELRPKSKEVAQNLHATLSQAIRALSGELPDKGWTQNVGRKNCHHSGLTMFLWKATGFLKPACRNDSKDMVRLGVQQRRFIIQKLDTSMRTKLASLDAFGRVAHRALPPQTIAEWEQEVLKLQHALTGPPKVCGFSIGASSYRSLWIIRCILIWKMRRHGISHLRLQSNTTVRTFAALFPDQRAWVLRLSGWHNQDMLVADLFKDCGYCGPPELFSMFTCLFGDTDLTAILQNKPKDWLETHRPGLLQALKKYQALHGMPPHPAVLVATYLNTVSK